MEKQVKCIDNTYSSRLTVDAVYTVVGEDLDFYRLQEIPDFWFKMSRFKTVQNDQLNIEAVKHDSNKPSVDLLPSAPLLETASVLDFGARKYTRNNWRKGMKWSRLHAAALRHLLAHKEGEDKDPESGLSHLAHAACCIMFLQEYEIRKLGEDDRHKT